MENIRNPRKQAWADVAHLFESDDVQPKPAPRKQSNQPVTYARYDAWGLAMADMNRHSSRDS